MTVEAVCRRHSRTGWRGSAPRRRAGCDSLRIPLEESDWQAYLAGTSGVPKIRSPEYHMTSAATPTSTHVSELKMSRRRRTATALRPRECHRTLARDGVVKHQLADRLRHTGADVQGQQVLLAQMAIAGVRCLLPIDQSVFAVLLRNGASRRSRKLAGRSLSAWTKPASIPSSIGI